MRGSIKALVPVRSGSKRVENKNLAPFAGSTLLDIKLMQLLKVRNIDGICVNSNDPEMLKIAERYGVETVLRDPSYATDHVPMSEVYSNMASMMIADHVLLTHVTNPMVDSQTYEKAVGEYFDRREAFDSLASVAKVQEFLYKDGEPLNYDPRRKPRSQDLPDIFRLTHAICILPRATMVGRKDSMGEMPYFLELAPEQNIDIDTPLDFKVAEFIYSSHHGTQ